MADPLKALELPVDDKQNVKIAIQARTGKEVLYHSHDYSDRSTWFQESVRVTAGPAPDQAAGAGTSFGLSQAVVDMTHGKLTYENTYVSDQKAENPGDPHGYAVVVYKDGVAQTERVPFASSGGDYTLDYETGIITPTSPWPGAVVTVDYSRVGSSGFTIAPDPGYVLHVEGGAFFYADPVTLNDTIIYEVLVGPVVVGVLKTIKTWRNVQELGAAFYGPIPAQPGPRGTNAPLHVVKVDFLTQRDIRSSQAMSLRVRLENDQPVTSDRAVIRWDCTVETE